MKKCGKRQTDRHSIEREHGELLHKNITKNPNDQKIVSIIIVIAFHDTSTPRFQKGETQKKRAARERGSRQIDVILCDALVFVDVGGVLHWQ